MALLRILPVICYRKFPFLRLYSAHKVHLPTAATKAAAGAGGGNRRLVVHFHMYFSRLIFELISDDAVRFLVQV